LTPFWAAQAPEWLVVLGREPVIVDTGTVGNRRRWLEDVFGLVDPKDVRWIFLSHDDHDHTGNLAEVLEMCRNATLVTTWFQVERLAGDYSLPLERMRWMNDGESFDAGDRRFGLIRPPVFDSPTTRGLYDSKTGVYWAGDSFAVPMEKTVENAVDLDDDFYRQWFVPAQGLIAPWHTMVDPAKYNACIDRIARLNLSAIASAHAPVTSGNRIEEAIAMLRTLPEADPAPLPGQADLEAIIASFTPAAA
jgi:flavorubredoxin